MIEHETLTVSIEAAELERVLTHLLETPEKTVKLTLVLEKKAQK